MSDTTARTPDGAGAGEGWSPLADRIALQAQDFVDGVTALATGQGGDQLVPLLLLEVSQIMLAGAQLGASKDVIPPGNWEPYFVPEKGGAPVKIISGNKDDKPSDWWVP